MESVWLCCGVTSDTWPEGLCGTADWQEVWDEAADTQPGLAQCLTTMNNAGGEDWAGPRLFRAPGDEGGRGVGFCSPPSPRAHLEHLTATDERVCGVHVLRFYHKFQLWPELCWLSFVSGSPAWPWDLFHRCAQNCATALWVSLCWDPVPADVWRLSVSRGRWGEAAQGVARWSQVANLPHTHLPASSAGPTGLLLAYVIPFPRQACSHSEKFWACLGKLLPLDELSWVGFPRGLRPASLCVYRLPSFSKMCLFGRQSDLLLVRCPNSCNEQGWAEQEPRATSFLRVSHVGAGIQALRPFSTVFPGALAGSWLESGQLGPGVVA